MNTEEMWWRLWARRYLIAKRSPFFIVGTLMVLSTGLKDSPIQNTLAALVGVGFILLAGATLLSDWNTKFTPRFWWRSEGNTCADEVRHFCEKKRIACVVDEDYGPGTGLGFRAGFITEDDLVLTRLSL